MVTTDRSKESRGPLRPQQVVFAELFFDLVFVFVATRLSERVTESLNVVGFHQSTVLLLAMWLVWYKVAWTTNLYAPTRPAIQLMVIGVTLGILLMAVAVPGAYGERGPVFASVYVTIQVIHPLWLVLSRGEDRDTRLLSSRILFWEAIAAVPWIVGALNQEARLAWWTAAVGLGFSGIMLNYPIPRLGPARIPGQSVQHEHLTERYRQALVIALGDSILTSGFEIAPFGFERDRTMALLVSFAITVLMWQIFFFRAGAALPVAIASSTSPVDTARLASYAHLIMVIGVIGTSAGDRLIIMQPLGHTEPSWILVVLGGPALFLVGRAVLDYVVFRRVSWSRPIGFLLLATLAPAALRMPPVMVAMVAAAVLAGVAVANVVSWRLFPRAPAPAPK